MRSILPLLFLLMTALSVAIAVRTLCFVLSQN